MKLFYWNRWGTAMMTVLVSLNFLGCGGGGGGGGSSTSDSQAQIPTPQTIGGNDVRFYSGSADTRAITFNEDNATWTENRDGNTTAGTYRYVPQPNTSAAELFLTEEEAESRIVLTFNSADSGAYVNADAQASGTFELVPKTPDPNPDPGNEPPPNDGLAPSALAGKTLYGTRTFTSTGPVGQTHVYTFALNTFHDSDPPEESNGSYLYQASGNTASLSLNYSYPTGFNGDSHELDLTFHTADAGIFQSLYTRRDGTIIRISGTFTIE
ncbi:MAG: hypothetical protein ACXW32_06465 [Limisphaerales bacterium]